MDQLADALFDIWLERGAVGREIEALGEIDGTQEA